MTYCIRLLAFYKYDLKVGKVKWKITSFRWRINLEGEEKEESHHKTEESHGLGQSESQDSVGEQLLLQAGVPGISDDEGTEDGSDTGSRSGNSDGGGSGSDELGGGVNVLVGGGGLESPGGNGGPLEAGGESHAAAGGDGQAGDGRHGVFYKYTVRLLYVVSQFTWSADNIMIKIGFIIITCFQVVESNLYFVGTYGVINAFLKQS